MTVDLISLEQTLTDLGLDAVSLSHITNDAATTPNPGEAIGTVTTRLGSVVKNVAKVIADLEAAVGTFTVVNFAPSSLTGIDTTFVTGTVGTSGQLLQWNSDGDAVAVPSVSVDGSGNLVVTGTVDGRDVAADGIRLDDLEVLGRQGYHMATGGPVAIATTANITLSGEQTIDGVLTSTNRILVKDQTLSKENGIYVTAAGAWARATDMNLAAEVAESAVFVTSGTINGAKTYVTYSTVTTIGIDNIVFKEGPDNSSVSRSFATRAEFVSYVAGGKTWTDGDVVSAGGVSYQKSTGSTDISDLPGWTTFSGLTYITAEHLGAIGDNITNDKTAISAILSKSDNRFAEITSGTFKVQMGGIAALTVGTNKHLTGKPGSSINFVADTAGTTQLMNITSPFTSHDVSYTATHSVAGATLQFFKASDDMFMFGSTITGGVTDNAGSQSHIAHAYQLDSNSVKNLFSLGNNYNSLSRVVLITNNSTNTYENLKFIGDTFRNNTSETLAINSPTATTTDVLFLGNSVFDNIADTLGGSGHSFGGANVQNWRAIANSHSGQGDEIIHLEEGASVWTAVGNVGSFTTARAGARITDNNIAGTYKAVELGTLSANVFKRATRLGGAAGIDLTPDGVGIEPLKTSVISGNVSAGWERGIRTADNAERNLITHNVVTDNDVGLHTQHPSLMTIDNLLIDSTVPANIGITGVLGHQFHSTESTWTVPNPLIKAPTIASSHEGGFAGWTTEYKKFTVNNVGTDHAIIPIGSAMVGDIYAFVSKNSVSRRLVKSTLIWDGTTLTHTNIFSYGAGITFVDFRKDASNNLAIRILSGATITNCNIQIKFVGMHLFI